MRKRPCLLFACMFLTGIAFQRYEWKALLLLVFGFLTLEIYWGVTCKKVKQMAGRSLLLLSAFFLGMSHMKSQEEFRDAYMSNLQDDSNAVIWGELIKIEETEYGNRLILTDCYVSLQEAIVPCNKVMVYASSDQFRVGQIYQIKGQLNLFENARNEGNFDTAVFYQSQKIDFSIYEKESVQLASNENVIRDWILELKRCMGQVYKNCLEEDAAGFYMGMLLGDKSLLSDYTKELFAVGGISHILAISGLHMSIIGRGFYKLIRKRGVGFLTAGVLAGLLLLAYCYMVGSGTSAIRAVGMMLIYFLAQYWGRSYDMLNALGAVVIYLLWENPFLLEYSGFQFSIVALIGVGFVGQRLSRESEKLSGLWMSMGITLSTLPIVACCYYEVPLYSPLVNSIVLPLLTPIFALALLGGLVGCVLPAVGMVMLVPCRWLFAFYEFVCEFVKKLPFGSIITGIPEMKLIVVYYVVLLIGCLILSGRRNDSSIVSSNSICIIFKKLSLCILCFTIILWPKSPQAEVIFLDVGQGDSIYVGSEDGTTLFIDGGSSDMNQVGTYRILPFLKAHGVRRIDYWFVSHADTDHISGLLEILEAGYEIGCLVISDKMPEDEKKEQLLSAANEQEVLVLCMKVGDQIQTSTTQEEHVFSSGGIRITCIYPWADATDRNEQSMVLLLDFLDENGGSIFKALFSGDISSEAESELIADSRLMTKSGDTSVLDDVDLYKAAHHGSKYSNSQELLKVIQPAYCVISCGIDNSYGHPHRETLERLRDANSEIMSTAEEGQITIQVDEEEIAIDKYLK